MLNNFEFSQGKEIVESWLAYVNKFSMNHPIMFRDRDNKTKFLPASFSYFLKLLKTNLKKCDSYNCYNFSAL